MSSRILLGAALLAIAACARGEQTAAGNSAGSTTTVTQAGDVTTARQMIDAANARFGPALVKNDTATIGGMYADNATLMIDGSPTMTGRAAILAGLGGYLSSIKLTDASVKSDAVEAAGDLAVETGRYDWTVQEKDGKVRHDLGRYLTVWQRQPDGNFRIIHDAAISDPAPAPAAAAAAKK